MQKHILIVLITFILSFTSLAQDETYTWEPYGLTVSIPDGWVVSPAEKNDMLVIMLGNDADLPVISIVATGNVSLLDEVLFDAISSRRRIEGETDANGYIVAEDFMSEMENRRTDMIQLNSHYMLFASAPRELWDGFAPELEIFLESIVDAPLYDVTHDLLLTKPVRFGNISLTVPADWVMASTGPYHNLTVIGSERERRNIGATFASNELSIELKDLTAMRAVLSEDILYSAQLFYVDLVDDPQAFDITPLEPIDIGDTIITGIEYTSDRMAGRAYYIRNADHAFLLAGKANPDMWDASEKALFEAIFATITVE